MRKGIIAASVLHLRDSTNNLKLSTVPLKGQGFISVNCGIFIKENNIYPLQYHLYLHATQ